MFCKIITVFQKKNREENVKNTETSNLSILGMKSFDFSHQNTFLLRVLPCIITIQLHKETKYQFPKMEFLSKISFQNHQSS